MRTSRVVSRAVLAGAALLAFLLPALSADADDAAFPLFAYAAANADEATSLGLGLNWYLSKVVLLKLDAYQTRFGFVLGAPAIPTAVLLRQDEKALITRFQISF